MNRPESYEFNSNERHFEPTDIVTIDPRRTVEEELHRAGFGFLLRNDKLLNQVLINNGLSAVQLKSKARKRFDLRLLHTKMYMKSSRGHPCAEPYRNRSFDLFAARIRRDAGRIFFDELRRAPHKRYAFLDIGSGTGRALLELKRDFPLSDVFGVCLPGENEDPVVVKRFFSIDVGDGFRPNIVEMDLNATSLTTGFDHQFDFIFSQATLRYVRDKARLIEDVHALLRPGGVAFLDLALIQIRSRNGKGAISLDIFFNQTRWSNTFRYSVESGLLRILKCSGREQKLRLTLDHERTRYKSREAAPERNSEVGWFSVYSMGQPDE